jgi:hypothetical protein
MQIDRPILLFGMPRSGTTWLGKIFDSHSRTLYRHEPDTFEPLADLPLLADPGDVERHRERLQRYLIEVVEMRSERVCAKQPIFPKAYSSGAGHSLHRFGALASKAAGRLGVELPVPGAGAPRGDEAWRLVWKSIESLGRLGLLLGAYGDARAVQILRHPCGFVASVLRGEAAQRFTHGGAAEDWGIFAMLCATPQAQRRGLTLEALQRLTPSERLAWRWVLYNEKASEDSAASGRCRRLYYEELCAEPLRVTQELFRGCELDWDEQTARFLHDSTSNAKGDYYSVFKDPLESAWKWRKELPGEDVERVLAVVAQSELGAAYLGESRWNRRTGS